MPYKFHRTFLYLLATILAINIVQSYYTELIFDEAYYWYYAQHLAFGYFDHPPMVAWMIGLGSVFFDGELGVRLVSCVLSIGTIALLWSIIDNPKKNTHVPFFFVLVFSMTLFNAYGFFTLPDTPLLFFTALFLWVYKKFIKNPTAALAIGLGLVMAALMYSKYHAVLVILFIVLSNLRLLADPKAWLAVIVALLAYMPHFIWLYGHDFISIKYHLFERPNDAYRFQRNTLGYVLNLVAIVGLTFPWVYFALIKTSAKDKFTRALLFLTYGVILFFFISSFNRRVQTQWIIAISIPLVLLVYNFCLNNRLIRKWVFRMGIANIIVLLFLRLGLVFEPLFPISYESHGNKVWVGALKSKIGELPVVFENSYRLAPMYTFYSGVPSYSLNNMNYRENQYSIDDSEKDMQHKRVFYISPFMPQEKIAFTDVEGQIYYGKYIEDFQSFRKLSCYINQNQIVNDTSAVLTLKVYNPYGEDIDLKKLKFAVGYMNQFKRVQDIIGIRPQTEGKNILTLKSNDTTNFTFKLPATAMEEPAYFRVGISENRLHYGLNGNSFRLK